MPQNQPEWILRQYWNREVNIYRSLYFRKPVNDLTTYGDDWYKRTTNLVRKQQNDVTKTYAGKLHDSLIAAGASPFKPNIKIDLKIILQYALF